MLAAAGQSNTTQTSNLPTDPLRLGRDSQTLLGSLLQQPLLAQALANSLREQANSLPTQLGWLGSETTLTLDAGSLRRQALARLELWDWEHGATDASQIARHYAMVFQERYQLLRSYGIEIPSSSLESPTASPKVFTAGHQPPAADTEWLLNIVLEHDDFCRFLVQSMGQMQSIPEMPADWYQNHQQLVESHSDARQALRIAEESLLQLFKQQLLKTATSW